MNRSSVLLILTSLLIIFMAVTPSQWYPLRLFFLLPYPRAHHVIPAAVFSIVLWLKLRGQGTGAVAACVWAVVATFLLGVSLEIVQIFLPYRGLDYLDIVANVQGIALGQAVVVSLVLTAKGVRWLRDTLS